MFPYYFLRFSGPLLFVFVGIKILSGYSLTGKLALVSWLSNLHQNRTLDFAVMVLFIFHALYGLRLFLIDFGMVRQEKLLFWASTIAAIGLFVFSYLYLL